MGKHTISSSAEQDQKLRTGRKPPTKGSGDQGRLFKLESVLPYPLQCQFWGMQVKQFPQVQTSKQVTGNSAIKININAMYI